MSIRLSILLLVFVTSCSTPGGNGIGPCVHTYEDPVIHVNQVTDLVKGQAIGAFKVTSALRDTFTVDAIILKGYVAYNAVVFDSVLICNTPCGFGIDEGTYTLSISAPNYRDTTIVVQAKYAVFKGGCPSSNSGGTIVNFQMQPQ